MQVALKKQQMFFEKGVYMSRNRRLSRFRRATPRQQRRQELARKEREWRELYPEAFRKKSRHTNRHHMTNKCRGGKDGTNNILIMDRQRHAKLHKLFGNMSWEEICSTLKSIFGVGEPHKVIAVMERISRLKGRMVA